MFLALLVVSCFAVDELLLILGSGFGLVNMMLVSLRMLMMLCY